MNPVFDSTKEPAISSDFPVKVPEYFNFATDVIDRWAEYDRNKLAMIWANLQGEERKLTFRDLERLSTQAANLLLSIGMKRGDRALVLLPRLPEWWILSLAMIRIGVVQCPSPTLLMPHDLKYRINFGGFKMVITDRDNAHKFDEIGDACPTVKYKLLVDGERENWIDYTAAMRDRRKYSSYHLDCGVQKFRSDELMLTVFTSGTSKNPEMVMHCYGYPLGHRVTAELWHGLNEYDLHITMSDTGWAKNLWGNYFGQWITGACLLILDIRGKFHPDELLPILAKYGVTSFCAPPTMYRMLIKEDLTKYDLSSVTHASIAGEALNPEVFRQLEKLTGLKVMEGFGQSESTLIIGNLAGAGHKLGSMGKACPIYHVELLDSDGNFVAPGTPGEICIDISDGIPIGLCRGYYRDEEKTKEAMHDGWYHTGDVAWRDEDGFYWYVGRADDVIKSSGYRIGPFEIESVIMELPYVLECGVSAAPDEVRGQVVKASIVLTKGTEPTEELKKEIQNYVKQHTAPYKYPRIVVFRDELPKTVSGKIQRALL